MPSISFLGAAGTVTGARFLVSTESARVLVDCGLFQGLKELRLRNWDAPGFDTDSLDAVVLTHAHMDHTGYLPSLSKRGYDGPVFATPPTIDLCGILLPDSGHLQEEQAAHANKHGYSKHNPALPLYTVAEAVESLRLLRPCPYGQVMEIAAGIRVRMVDAGHILGSAIVEMWLKDRKGEIKVTFSGDLGRYGEPLLADPTAIAKTDYLVVESTYGNRVHTDSQPEQMLAQMVGRTARSGGCLLIPAFSVGRTQQILYTLRSLERTGQIPSVPVYVDSPMAIDATAIFLAHPEAHRLELRHLEENGDNPLRPRGLLFVRSAEDSRELDNRSGPMVLISASGMATGGRVLHHLDAYLPDQKATVLFVGYQADGTRGRTLLEGAKEMKMLGHKVRVRAEIAQIDGFSAHADRDEIVRWLSGFQDAPKTTFLVHGEGDATSALGQTIKTRYGWETIVPALGQEASL